MNDNLGRQFYRDFKFDSGLTVLIVLDTLDGSADLVIRLFASDGDRFMNSLLVPENVDDRNQFFSDHCAFFKYLSEEGMEALGRDLIEDERDDDYMSEKLIERLKEASEAFMEAQK